MVDPKDISEVMFNTQSSWLKAILHFSGIFIVSFLAMNEIKQADISIPHPVPISIIISILAVVILNNIPILANSKETYGKLTIFLYLIIIIGFVALWFLSSLSTSVNTTNEEPIFQTKHDFNQWLSSQDFSNNLNELEIEFIMRSINEEFDRRGFVSQDQFEDIFNGFMRSDEVKRLMDNQIDIRLTAIAIDSAMMTQIAPHCTLSPIPRYSDVALRKSPNHDGDWLSPLYRGQQVEVIGHNGGYIGNDRYWLIEIAGKGQGWVFSGVVYLNDEEFCLNVPRIPGF